MKLLATIVKVVAGLFVGLLVLGALVGERKRNENAARSVQAEPASPAPLVTRPPDMARALTNEELAEKIAREVTERRARNARAQVADRMRNVLFRAGTIDDVSAYDEAKGGPELSIHGEGCTQSYVDDIAASAKVRRALADVGFKTIVCHRGMLTWFERRLE